MGLHSSLTQEELEALLEWLDPDRDLAVAQYEVIRRGLIQRFVRRGCIDAESLADETIDRVTKKLPEIGVSYEGNRIRYFHGVAKRVFQEYCRVKRRETRRAPPEPEPTFSEPYFHCLELCLDRVEAEKRDLILRYYSQMKQAKIESRKIIRQEMKLKSDALRVRTYRIRQMLKECISECVASNETL